jgi:hypothetical protein
MPGIVDPISRSLSLASFCEYAVASYRIGTFVFPDLAGACSVCVVELCLDDPLGSEDPFGFAVIVFEDDRLVMCIKDPSEVFLIKVLKFSDTCLRMGRKVGRQAQTKPRTISAYVQ